MKHNGKLLETIFCLSLALGLTLFILHLKSELITPYTDLILAGVWLYLPLIFILLRKESLKNLGLTGWNLGSSLKWFLLTSLFIFPPFYLICFLGAHHLLNYRFQLMIPKNLLPISIGHLLLVALPEEWFFRGYLEGRFNQILLPRWELFYAQIGPGLFLSAILFAFAHFIVHPSPERLLVFFPALIFGWLREKTNSLVAPILFHFLANLSFIIFQGSLLK